MRSPLFTSIIAAISIAVPGSGAILLQLDAPNQSCAGFCSLDFVGSIRNTGEEIIYLNGTQIGATPGVTLDDSPFYLYTPFFLNPGEQYTGMLFSAVVELIWSSTMLTGEFAIFGGPGSFDYEELDRVSFSIEVQGSEVPETGTVALISIPLMGVLLLSRRR